MTPGSKASNNISDSEDDYEELEREFMTETMLADSLTSPRKSTTNNKSSSKSFLLSKMTAKLSSQRFVYNNGFISLVDVPGLVLTVPPDVDASATVCEVFLARKNEDSVHQRWVYRADDGLIVSRLPSRSLMCLSLRLPAIESTGFDVATPSQQSQQQPDSQDQHSSSCFYDQAPVIVQLLVDYQNGNAQQRWSIDQITGFIYAFAASNTENIGKIYFRKVTLDFIKLILFGFFVSFFFRNYRCK